jgi:hypothetical protein
MLRCQPTNVMPIAAAMHMEPVNINHAAWDVEKRTPAWPPNAEARSATEPKRAICR